MPRAAMAVFTPLILAVDTTHEFGSLALARDGAVVAEVPCTRRRAWAGVVRLPGTAAGGQG